MTMKRREFIESAGLAATGMMFMSPSTVLANNAFKRERRKIAVVGTGVRGVAMFGRDIVRDYSDYVQIVGLCDINPGRLKYASEYIGANCPTFTDLDELITRQKPDTLIVTTTDSAHHEVIIRGLAHGCNIITEKPLTIDAVKAQAIIDAEKKYGKKIIVTFNYRYPPYRARIKELLMQGIVGDIQSAEFHYYLDHAHLTRYMQRWHGETKFGGSLWVHKATHHFDMANWFIDSEPEQVFAYSTLERFGSNGPFRGKNCRNCAFTKECPYYWDITQNSHLVNLYTANEHYDGYVRDNCVFRHQIDIYDKHSALVKYANGVQLNYLLTGHSDYQGYYLAFDGTKGRLEARVGGVTDNNHIELVFIPTSKFTDQKVQIIKAEHSPGGHWGGDPIMMDKLFKDPDMPDPLGQQAGVRDGVMSILIGIAARQSTKTGLPVNIRDLTDLRPKAKRQPE